MRIRKGEKRDAQFLSKVVTEAIGDELSVGLAGSEERRPLVDQLFASLAGMENSQYSYRNAIIAEDEEGNRIGGIIAYDGARLHELRKAFVKEANRLLGWNVTDEATEEWGDEADAGEVYIDSLYVVPEARQKGVATALIKSVEERYGDAGKPLGLLVEPENAIARRAYLRRGFGDTGVSNFFRTPMIHMQKK